MKKVLLSFVIMAGAMSISAQSEFHFIVKGGLNASTITNLSGTRESEDVSKVETDWKTGFNIGAGLEWNPNGKVGIETGLYYSEYGTKYRSEGLTTVSYTTGISHLQIPVLAKYYVYKGFNIFAGPQIGYRLSSKTKPGNLYNLYGKKLNYSAIAGLGYQFNSGLLISANYIYGLTNLDGPSYESSLSGGSDTGGSYGPAVPYKSIDAKIRAFQFNIGWRF
jgi:opacity protein-like surface antigen